MKGARKLAAAMRLGAKLRPQCTVDLFRDGASCALGAAYEGATGKTDARNSLPVLDVFPVLSETVGNEMLMDVIWQMNDLRGMTREQIADWLDTLEPDDKAWATERVRKLLEGTPSVDATEAVNSPAATETK